jgi:hypothetical protein
MILYLIPYVACTLCALAYQLKIIRLGPAAYGMALFLLGLVAGIRFEAGQDWDAYEDYFDEVVVPGFDLVKSRYEPAYYILNYLVKTLGGTYPIVQLIASMFCAFAVYRLTSRMTLNRFYVLAVYMGYSYLVLHFAQVRQSLALGFFLLGLDHYFRHGTKLPAMMIALIGPFFQLSALLYFIVLAPVIIWQSGNVWWWLAAAIAAVIAVVAAQFIDLVSLISMVSSSNTQDKLAIYSVLKTEQGPFQIIYACYLLLLCLYFVRFSRGLTPDKVFIIRYAVCSLAVTVMCTFLLAGSYVFYSRAYSVACLFQGFAAAIVFASRKGALHSLVFYISLAVASVSYCRIIDFYEDQYTPYQIFFWQY